MPLAIERSTDPDRWTIDVPDQRDSEDLPAALDAAIAEVAEKGGGETHLWIHDIDDPADAIANAAGFTANRDLWQLRCALPAEPSTIETRAFTPADADAMIGVNNRAFSWHPEQSGMTRDSLAATMAEPWFDPDGFRLFERDGEVLGFCWTKVHADEEPPAGEVFVIAVDPDHHGKGLGRALTLAGYQHLEAQGITRGILYVDADNTPAVTLYLDIGLEVAVVRRLYTRA